MSDKELKDKPARGKAAKKADGPAAVREALAALPDADRLMGERLHAVITGAAPDLVPKLWYGMPAYARDGKVIVFYQAAAKFKTRYATLGFGEDAQLDDGTMWPTAFAVTELTAADEARIAALVTRAAS